jgi:hypothetical protein
MFMRPKALMANKYDWLEDLTSQEEDMTLKVLSICRILISIRVKRPHVARGDQKGKQGL